MIVIIFKMSDLSKFNMLVGSLLGEQALDLSHCCLKLFFKIILSIQVNLALKYNSNTSTPGGLVKKKLKIQTLNLSVGKHNSAGSLFIGYINHIWGILAT